MHAACVSALLLALVGSLAGDARAASLESEADRLEAVVRAGHARSQDRERLAQIYFLTSRCPDVLRTLEHVKGAGARALTCVCGGACDANTRVGRVSRLRALLDRRTSWESPTVQAVWREVRQTPEAQYWVLRYLTNDRNALRRNAKRRKLREELESHLRSLEVSP